MRFGESGGAGRGWKGLVVRHTEIGVGVGRWWTAAWHGEGRGWAIVSASGIGVGASRWDT